ncbi:hypothetical protein CRM22_008624 [Opisthorchis felineus]|uniref:Uncharacterized protein n=1 Tax=Opisthorchis felineus TaxID=147828 RepID=A0A4S2LAZ0_OPIFE|nr:hypothetical protein CRM22_008624 [Opisthorchis felineus]
MVANQPYKPKLQRQRRRTPGPANISFLQFTRTQSPKSMDFSVKPEDLTRFKRKPNTPHADGPRLLGVIINTTKDVERVLLVVQTLCQNSAQRIRSDIPWIGWIKRRAQGPLRIRPERMAECCG